MKSEVFTLDNASVQETLKWAKDVAELDVNHLRSTIVAGGEFCDLLLSMKEYYQTNLAECREWIAEGKGDSVINRKKLPLLQIGERLINLEGYLILLQMDATMSLINMMEAESDPERLLHCKHAYSILYDFQEKGLFKVISKEMHTLPDEILPKEEVLDLWADIKQFNRQLMDVTELKDIRNNIDSHKSSFSEQIAAYKRCEFCKCFVNTYALMKLAWLFQEAMSIARRHLSEFEDCFVEEVKERLRQWEAMRRELVESDR